MRVCFVCVGNICRSPAAQAILEAQAAARGVNDLIVDSAGTTSYHQGEDPHPSTLAEAAARGVPIDHRSRPVVAADFERFDLLVVVDSWTLRDVKDLAPPGADLSKIVLLGAYDPDAASTGARDVADPWGRAQSAFTTMWDQLESSCAGLLDAIVAGNVAP